VRILSLMGIGAAAALILAATPALAAQAEPSAFKFWWSWSWRIINFLVLAFVIVKMAKQPLKDFLSGQKAKVVEELEAMEKAKAVAQAELNKIQQQTSGLAQELADYEKAFADMAARERTRLTQDAAKEAELILERAKLTAKMALRQAIQTLTEEMVELAADLAQEKLKQAVSAQDQTGFLEQFTSLAQEAKSEA
jgi:F-type H+-transporting ATPase subunit b